MFLHHATTPFQEFSKSHPLNEAAEMGRGA